MPRSRLGPLALESKLGDNPSQSLVWRAIHVDLHRAVAVKVFPTPFGGTLESRQVFADEWELLKRLQHPAIARCYGGGFEETDAYLAYELIDGETLAQQLERRGRLNWDVVLDFATPIAEALAVAHQLDLFHAAITPTKVMIAGIAPILIDFRKDRFHSLYRNPRQMTVLESALQAPEVLEDVAQISRHSDIYSLGALMYLALTGRPPLSGTTLGEIRRNAIAEIPQKAAAIALDCPVWVSTLLQQMLEKDPSARPFDATALAMALGEARRRSGGLLGVAEHNSGGFSPLQMVKPNEKEEARKLLGRDTQAESSRGDESYFDNTWVLIGALAASLAFMIWLILPASEAKLRARAETLIAEQTRTSLEQAKNGYLVPLTKRFPNTESATWAQEQIDEIEMRQAEYALDVKLNKNLPLRDEGERLYADALRFERFGDKATALDKYKSLVTLFGNETKYKPFVMLARRQMSVISRKSEQSSEAVQIVQAKLAEADRLSAQGDTVAAKLIWYSIVELYSQNSDVAPLVKTAQQRLGSATATPVLSEQ